MRLSWALVHSRQPEDVNRGIGMLEGGIFYFNIIFTVSLLNFNIFLHNILLSWSVLAHFFLYVQFLLVTC